MKTINCNDPQKITELLTRKEAELASVEKQVSEIIAQIRSKGDVAVRNYSEQFDGVCLAELEVSESEIELALREVDPDFLAVLEESAKNIYAYHEKQKRSGYVMADKPGVVLGSG